MSGGIDDRTLPREELAAMLRVVRPGWRLVDAELADNGRASIYRLGVDTGAGRRECVLKTAPADDEPFDIATEARVQAVVDAHTDVPVPAVLGVVDAHDDLRTPYFLMEALPGETLSRTAVGDLADGTLRGVAHETGRYLGQLHDLEVGIDAFGADVAYEGATTLRGGLPGRDPARLVGDGGHDRWSGQLREWFEGDLELVADSRFADMGPALRGELARQIDGLPTDPAPVFGRIDHHWENVLLDRETGTVAGVIDWGETTAFTRGLSLAIVEYFLAWDWWMVLPEVPDRRPLVRAALLAGYREEAAVPATYEAERRCYQLSMLVRDLGQFERRVVERSAIPDDRVEEAAAHLRATVEAAVDGDGL